MSSALKLFTLIILACYVAACAGSKENNAGLIEQDVVDLIMCEEPRPQICTREYNPVCATLKDGSKKTASTGCTSCSDPQVIGYTMGTCKTK